MTGVSRSNFMPLDMQAHILQSVQDILTTPIGSLVMEREYGSRLLDLVDAPINGETKIELYVATAEAIDRWEPRLRLERIEMLDATSGQIELRLFGRVRDGVFDTVVEVAA